MQTWHDYCTITITDRGMGAATGTGFKMTKRTNPKPAQAAAVLRAKGLHLLDFNTLRARVGNGFSVSLLRKAHAIAASTHENRHGDLARQAGIMYARTRQNRYQKQSRPDLPNIPKPLAIEGITPDWRADKDGK